MTMRTNFLVKCDCGHEGSIRLSENDQPYSDPWESYSLQNLNSNGGHNIERASDWEDVFNALKPSCPICGRSLSVNNLVKNKFK